MSKNATGVDQNREDEDGRISQDAVTPTAGTNQADNLNAKKKENNMTAVVEEKVLTDEQRFKQMLADCNDELGFSLTLDDRDAKSDYAHGTSVEKNYTITCQMDKTNDHPYALRAKLEGLNREVDLDGMTKKDFDKVLKTDAFKTRIAGLKMLDDLSLRIAQEYQQLSENILVDSISETEKADAYDAITTAARKLLRD